MGSSHPRPYMFHKEKEVFPVEVEHHLRRIFDLGFNSISKVLRQSWKVLTIHLLVVYMLHSMGRYFCTGVTTRLVVCCMRGQRWYLTYVTAR